MQILEVLVVREPGSRHVTGTMFMSPRNANKPARMITRNVEDRKYVGSKIIKELDHHAVCTVWHQGDLLRVEVAPDARVRLNKLVRQVEKIIDTYADYMLPTNDPLKHVTM